MPFKDRDYRLLYRRKWYAKNKESEKEHVRRRKNKIKQWLQNYKLSLKCFKCLENHPATLEFHHKKSKEKEKTISQMVVDGISIKKILDEIKKCEVLCANCHRKVHFINKINKL